jgi:hypothetical protein
MTRAEDPMSFRDSLPPEARDRLWMPRLCLTLTLPALDGSYTAFQVKYCPQSHEMAHNVARYHAPEGRTP